MKILSIDTSSNVCGVSILEDENLICKLDTNTGRTHSENLMPMIDEALKKAELKPTDINLIVCDIGPGSFTGIRIGVATAKAFSDSLNIPSVGISSLETLAFGMMSFGKYVCSMIDCKNDNCYFALFELKDKIYNVIEQPESKSVQDVLVLLNKYSEQVIHFVGDGLSEKSTNSYLNVENLGIAGFKKFLSNNNQSEEILPLYLKKPQAQRQLEEKLKGLC